MHIEMNEKAKAVSDVQESGMSTLGVSLVQIN